MIRPALRWVLAVALVAGTGVVFVFREHLDAAFLESWVASAGVVAPLLFMAVYALGTVLFVPGSLLTLAGGALFGPVWGTFYNLTGATAGATLAFLVARYLTSDWVQARTAGRLGRVIRGVEAEGWRFVAFTRLVPLFPFNLLNYALGLTRIPLSRYLAATYVCMLPGALAYTYLGYAGREAIAGAEGLVRKGLVALALLAAAAFLPRLVARLRERPMMEVAALRKALEQGAGLLVLDVRPAGEFVGEQGHIRGAIHLPLEELDVRTDELGDNTDRAIAIVSRTGRRAARAAALLARRGFADVHAVRGGMTAWCAAGWPVERDK
jgi:uncharacterized membrane protein YdjX (TVP38/TMEM64 family)/rhodanese-related sulfurtransferase